MTYSLPGKPRLEVSDNAQLSSGVVLEIVVGDYVLTVCYAAPVRVRDRVCMHAPQEKIFSRKFRVKIFMLLLFQSLQKVQLEVNSVLWGIYMSPDTFNLLEIGMILCGTVD
jgi:hypothetical protein